MCHAARKGFTLIELLVVIAIIAVLAAILFPVFARAREKARGTTCSSNQRQIAVSIQMYCQDHEETLPSTGSIWQNINADAGILACPTLGKTPPNGYVYDGNLNGMAIGKLADPTTVFFTADGFTSTTPGVSPNVEAASSQFDYRHSKKLIASFADGHVGTQAATDTNWWLNGLATNLGSKLSSDAAFVLQSPTFPSLATWTVNYMNGTPAGVTITPNPGATATINPGLFPLGQTMITATTGDGFVSIWSLTVSIPSKLPPLADASACYPSAGPPYTVGVVDPAVMRWSYVFMKFQLPSVPSTYNITSANLMFYVDRNGDSTGYTFTAYNVPCDQSWSESSSTTTATCDTTTPYGTTTPPPSPAYVTLSLTPNLVKAKMGNFWTVAIACPADNSGNGIHVYNRADPNPPYLTIIGQ
jgi:prepilin-type N-terminal cleavage/methylation domain-containing protein/prepilin-type processing-associated H-X9-DG protein